jgi:hypothetical protein
LSHPFHRPRSDPQRGSDLLVGKPQAIARLVGVQKEARVVELPGGRFAR